MWYNGHITRSFVEMRAVMARTYLSGLILIVKQLCRYNNKYQDIILANLTTETQKALYLAIVAACTALMQSDIPEVAKND